MSELIPWISIALSGAQWFRTRKLARRLEDVEFELATLRRVPEPVPEPVPAPVPEPVIRRPEPPPLPRVVPVVEPPLPPPIPEPEPEAVPAESYLTRLIRGTGGWEALIGGNLLNKLGALISVIGVALFLSYSFAHMGPFGRTATGLAISLPMLGAGVWWERSDRYRIFARGLIAAGWASLYFTAFAMHAIEAARVISSPALGVAMMTAFAAGMVAHSLRYRVETLTALAFGCVFAALSLSESNLLVAIAIVPIAVSMLYLAGRFDWQGIALLAAAATYTTFMTRPSTGSPLWQIEAMLLLYWAIFEAADILRGESGKPLLFGLNALAGLGASAAIWYRLSPETMSQYCAYAAAAYWVSTVARLIRKSNLLASATIAISSVLSALAIFAHLSEIWIPLGTLIEGELLFAAYLALRLPAARFLAYGIFGVAIVQAFSLGDAAPPAVVMALVFYLNRWLSRTDRTYSYAASALIAAAIWTDAPWSWAGTAWLLFGVALLEFGARTGLTEFRHQAYALLAAGTLGTVPSDRTYAYAIGTVLTLGTAIRATAQRWLRIGGSIGATMLGAILATRFTAGPYDAIAMMGASCILFELAIRGFPAELRRPTLVLNLLTLAILIRSNIDGFVKHPAQPVWISAGIAALIYALITLRTLRETGWTRTIAPGLGTALAMLTLWMVLPDAYVPAAFAALAFALTEAGPSDLVSIGRVAALAAPFAIYLGSLIGPPLIASSLLIAGLHAWLWQRHSQHLFSRAHAWMAVAIIAVMFPIEWPKHWLAAWSAFGLALAALSNLRCQALAVAAIAAAFAIFGDDAAWQRAVAASALGAALLFESREGRGAWIRGAYGISAAITGAVTLFREVSGGLLTLSWGLEAIALLAAGFALRERPMRLSGLALFLLCIGKLFVYDLRNLETLYRILSFAGLGAMLLAVSWAYTRFRELLNKYL